MLDLDALERINAALNGDEPTPSLADLRPSETSDAPAPSCPHLARIAAE